MYRRRLHMLPLVFISLFLVSTNAWTDLPAFKTCLTTGSGGVNLTCPYHPVFNAHSKPIIRFEGAYCGQVVGGENCDIVSSEAGNCIGSARMNLTFWKFCNEKLSCYIPDDQVLHYCEFSECGNSSIVLWHSCMDNQAYYPYFANEPLGVRPKWEPISYPTPDDTDHFTECIAGTNTITPAPGGASVNCPPTAPTGRTCVGHITPLNCSAEDPYGVRILRVPYGDNKNYCNTPAQDCYSKDLYYFLHTCNRARTCWANTNQLTYLGIRAWSAHNTGGSDWGMYQTSFFFRPYCTTGEPFVHVQYRCNMHMYEPITLCSSRGKYTSFTYPSYPNYNSTYDSDPLPYYTYLSPKQKFNEYEYSPPVWLINLMWHNANFRLGVVHIPAFDIYENERELYPLLPNAWMHILEASRLHSWPCLTEAYRTPDSCLHMDALKTARARAEGLGLGERTSWNGAPNLATVATEKRNARNLIQQCGYAEKFCYSDWGLLAYANYDLGYHSSGYDFMAGYYNPLFVQERYLAYYDEFDNRFPLVSLTWNIGTPCYRSASDCAASIIWDPSGGCDMTVYPSKAPRRVYESDEEYGSGQAYTNVVSVWPDNYRSYSNNSIWSDPTKYFYPINTNFINESVTCSSDNLATLCRVGVCTGRNLLHFQPTTDYPAVLTLGLTATWRATFNDDLWCDLQPGVKPFGSPCEHPLGYLECYDEVTCDGVTTTCHPTPRPNNSTCVNPTNSPGPTKEPIPTCFAGICMHRERPGPCFDPSEVPMPCSDTMGQQTNVNGECLYPPLPNTTVCQNATPCAAQSFCDGENTTCPDSLFSSSFICASSDQCKNDAYCTGVSASCPLRSNKANFTVCAADPTSNVCEDNVNGHCLTGSCVNDFLPNTVMCASSTSDCLDNAYCTGSSPNCPVLPIKANFTVCTPSATSNACDDNINGHCVSGSCLNDWLPNTHVCANSSSFCINDSYCTGSGPNCPALANKPDLTFCPPGPTSNACEDNTNGNCISGSCVHYFLPSSHKCANATSVCVNDAYCTGTASSCPALLNKPDMSPCVPNLSLNTCEDNSTGTCQSGVCVNTIKPALTTCAISVSDCIMDSVCDGLSPICPTTIIKPDNTPCFSHSDKGNCSKGMCLSGTCATVYEPLSTVCDNFSGCSYKVCDGTSSSCLQIRSKANHTACTREPHPNELCLNSSVATCQNGICANDFLPYGTQCGNTTTHECITSRQCTGSSALCPLESNVADGTLCNLNFTITNTFCIENSTCLNGLCVENPAPLGTICNNSSGECENNQCDGTSILCPIGETSTAGSNCTGSYDVCVESATCDGLNLECSKITFFSATTPCVIYGQNGNVFKGTCQGSAAHCVPLVEAAASETGSFLVYGAAVGAGAAGVASAATCLFRIKRFWITKAGKKDESFTSVLVTESLMDPVDTNPPENMETETAE